MTDSQHWQLILERVLKERLQTSDDGSHDLAHLQRVWRHCLAIVAGESVAVDTVALVASAYLHDWINLPKDSPDRAQASRLSAEAARELLPELGFPAEKLSIVEHAIEAHSFSAGVIAQTAEARILQDADRLEALGALGIARTFYIAGMMQSTLFDPTDPLAERRKPDDRVSALDHFYTKLLQLPKMMHTATARNIADRRVEFMRAYLQELKSEIVGE